MNTTVISFETLELADVRMIYLNERDIWVTFKDRTEAVFKFPSPEQMEAAIQSWGSCRLPGEKAAPW